MPRKVVPAEATCCPPESAESLARLAGSLDGSQADEELAAFAKAVGHPMRVRILRVLARKESRMCCHLVDELPLAQSTVSEHIRILKSAGIVQSNGKGERAGYCIVPAALKRLKALLEAI